MIYSKDREDELKANGVAYKRITNYLDPSIRSSDIRKFDMLLVTPDNYDMSGKGIWKNDLDAYLTQVWGYQDSGHTIAALYKVRLS
jgi:hypothetical protein